MNALLNRFKTKPTFFLIVAPIILIGAIPTFFYTINLNGGESMYGFIVIGFFGLAIFALIFDYILVKFISHYIVSIIEIILVVLFAMANSYI